MEGFDWSALKAHPAADIFPVASAEAITSMAEDIRARGLLEPIALEPGTGLVIDGRARAAACRMAGIEPRFVDLPAGVDPWDFVVSKNLVRRHLTAAQRAFAAARLASMRSGERTDLAPRGARSQPEVAKRFGTSRRSVQRAKRILENGAPELVAAAESGKVGLKQAEALVHLPHGQQRAQMQRGRSRRDVEPQHAQQKDKRLTCHGIGQEQKIDIRPDGVPIAFLLLQPGADFSRLENLDVVRGTTKSALVALQARHFQLGDAVALFNLWGLTVVGTIAIERDDSHAEDDEPLLADERLEFLLLGIKSDIENPAYKADSIISAANLQTTLQRIYPNRALYVWSGERRPYSDAGPEDGVAATSGNDSCANESQEERTPDRLPSAEQVAEAYLKASQVDTDERTKEKLREVYDAELARWKNDGEQPLSKEERSILRGNIEKIVSAIKPVVVNNRRSRLIHQLVNCVELLEGRRKVEDVFAFHFPIDLGCIRSSGRLTVDVEARMGLLRKEVPRTLERYNRQGLEEIVMALSTTHHSVGHRLGGLAEFTYRAFKHDVIDAGRKTIGSYQQDLSHEERRAIWDDSVSVEYLGYFNHLEEYHAPNWPPVQVPEDASGSELESRPAYAAEAA